MGLKVLDYMIEKRLAEQSLLTQVLNTWKIHNDINLYLLGAIPRAGFQAVPIGSRGRTVVEQFVHMNRIRVGWLHFHRTGKRPQLEGAKGANPSRTELKKVFVGSGKAVSKFLTAAFWGEAAPKAFGKNALRWMGYLISHESHHRGQIMLALKQNGMRLPEKISIPGLWGKWMWGK